MKKVYLLIIFCSQILISNLSKGQAGEWVWLHGSASPGSAGSHGIKGVASPSNDPPALYETCEWTDLNGKFWMFGGLDAAENIYTDLWQFDTATTQWTWVNGPNTVNDPGNYGTQGVPSPSNYPPSRSWGVASWVDLNGNLWLFGGDKTVGGALSDLWKYDVASNQWTWMKGPNTTGQGGTYGTKGVPDPANNPGCRWECATAWTDKTGDLWLFGGIYNTFNDMWRYNIASNAWTWMKGSQSTGQPSVYGIKGVEDSLNTPGGRAVHTRWKDNCGNLWLFGGNDLAGSFYNDLWRFNPTTNNWTWMNGDTIGNSNGFYGSKCVADSSNTPGAREEGRAAWTDTSGNFWMFGGAVGGADNLAWNDLWMYCTSNNQWMWVGGDTLSNPIGSWGLVGVASPTNQPNGRAGSVGWTDNNGHLYFFGGTTTNFNTPYNDLWQYNIDPNCGSSCSINAACFLPVASFQSNDTSICAFDCINFSDHSTDATSWQWSFSGATPASSTDKNPQNICYLTEGIYNVTLIVSNSLGTDTLNYSSYIAVHPAPVTPVITQFHDTLFCKTDPTYISYQWYDDTTLIPGATDTLLIFSHNGNYNIKVTNTNGCSIAVGINIDGIISFESQGITFTLNPNPANDQLVLSENKNQGVGKLLLNIYNVLGQKLREEVITLSGHDVINVQNLASGIYFMHLTNARSSVVLRFVKE